MKNLLLALCLLIASFPVEAGAKPKLAAHVHHDRANNRARALIERMKKHPPKKKLTASAPLINFSSSPRIPTQYQSLTWVAQFDNPFTNRLLSIEATNNGVPVTNIQSPYKGMFVIALGNQTQAGAGTLVVNLYAEDAANNADVRTAIASLDSDVRRLLTQINAARNPATRLILQEQRDEKLALKNELSDQLKAYRWSLGSQTQMYTVAGDSSAPSALKITGISPLTGSVSGGTLLEITGANFNAGASVYMGGLASPAVTFVSSTKLQALTPDFTTVKLKIASTGPKDVEVRQGGINAVLPGAFFATNVPDVGSQKPVAIATGSQHIRLGDSAGFDGGQSYSFSNSSLAYQWVAASAPANSSIFVGQSVGASVAISFTPDVVGTYVFSLTVTDNDSSQHFSSEPSIVVVQVDGAPHPIANPINVSKGQSITTQVLADSPTIGNSIIFSIAQNPLHGTASITSSGSLTFTAASDYEGNDSIVVRATDQNGLSGDVVIPVVIAGYQIGLVVTADPIVSHTEPATSQVIVADAEHSHAFNYEIIAMPAHGTASISAAGLVTYAPVANYQGDDSLVVKVFATDNTEIKALVQVQISVVANNVPQLSIPGDFIAISNATATGVVLVTDDTHQTGTFSVSTAAHGTASIGNDGTLTYLSNTDFHGFDSVIVSFTDNGNPGLTGHLTVPITVFVEDGANIIADAPRIVMNQGDTATSQITAHNPAPTNPTLVYEVVTQPAHGTASVSSTGLISVTANANVAALDTVLVKVSDATYPESYNVTLNIPITIKNPGGFTLPALYSRIFMQGVPYQVYVGLDPNGSQLNLSSPNGTIASAMWDFGDGTRERITDLTFGGVLHNYIQTGTYVATLIVTDSSGASSSNSFNVVVEDTPVPVAKFTVNPSTGGDAPLTVTFDASASTSVTGILQYRWYVCNRLPEVVTTIPTYTTTIPGNCNARLRVVAPGNGHPTGQATVAVIAGMNVSATKVIANMVVGPPREVVDGGTFSFDGTLSFNPNYGGSDLANYSWRFNDPQCSDGCIAAGATATHAYPTGMSRFPTLQVDTGTGNVSNVVPVEVFPVAAGQHLPHAVTFFSRISGTAPFTITMDGSWSYAYGGVKLVEYSWYIGSQNIENGPVATHTFDTPGSYMVLFNAVDENGNRGTVVQPISVTGSVSPPRPLRVLDARDGGGYDDPFREYRRQLLAASCSQNDGAACASLAEMYDEDGDPYMATQLRAMACSFGYSVACVSRE